MERVVLVALAVMLVRVILLSVLHAYRIVRLHRATDLTTDARRKLTADVSIKVNRIKLVAFIAPYLGLVGTCIGLLSTFRGYIGTKQGFVIMVVSGIQAALLSTAAGILVAVPATFFHNYLRTRIDLLENSMPIGTRRERMFSHRARLAAFPFAPIAASILGVIFVAFIAFPRFHNAQGLSVGLLRIGALRDAPHSSIEPIVITVAYVKGSGPSVVFVNSKKTPWEELENQLGNQLQMRAPDSLTYVQAEDGVLWKDVTNAIDVVDGLRGRVVLLTSKPNVNRIQKAAR